MSKSIHKLIDEQVKRWELGIREDKPIEESINIVTISREFGSQAKSYRKKF